VCVEVDLSLQNICCIAEIIGEYRQMFQKRVCYKLNVLREEEQWWSENMEILRKKLGKKRKNIQETIQRKIMSKYK
jgi:hypothetical protein